MIPETLDTQNLEWRHFDEAPGVSYKVLRHHEGRRGITLLLRFAPGAHYPRHRHPTGEEYYVLDGDLREGDKTYGADTYVYHPPGSIHTPFSPNGCTLLINLPTHIERTDA